MNIKQHKFVTEYLRFQDKIVAYNNAYPNSKRNGRATESSANRLMQKPEIAQIIADALETTMYNARQELKDQMKEELLTVYQKRLLCRRVVLGEVREEITVKGKDCNQCTYYREISYNTKLRYSREDSLLAGHYIYGKKQPPVHIAPQQQDIPPLPVPPNAGKEVPRDSGAEDVNSSNATQQQEIENRNKTQQNEETPTPASPAHAGFLGGDSRHRRDGVVDSRTTTTPQETTHITQSTPGSATPTGGGQNNIPQQTATNEQAEIPPLPVPPNAGKEDVNSRNATQQQEIEKRNKTQQNEETPLLFLGGDIGDVPTAQEPIGVVDSWTIPTPQETTHVTQSTPGSATPAGGGTKQHSATNYRY